MSIEAKIPITVPGTEQVTYDQWFLSQLIIKAEPGKASTVVELTRSTTVDGNSVLMPRGEGAKVSFTLDAYKEIANTPEMAVAMKAVFDAVFAYANKNNLIYIKINYYLLVC